MTALAALGTVLLVAMLGIALSNARAFPRLEAAAFGRAGRGETVSILIPARNEGGRIGPTVERILAQSPGPDELLVLDDLSTDDTAAEARRAARGDPRVRVVTGRPLPPAWVGKSWACQQLADLARGELLIFTDADVLWEKGSLDALLHTAGQLEADLLTVWPTQITRSAGERLVVPMMSLAVQAYLPVGLVHRFYRAEAAAANGQCLAFRREAYERIGRHAAVGGAIVEDVQLARRVKAAGLNLRMADGNGLIRCRMYRNWQEARNGFAKNILAGHGDSLALLALSTLGHLGLFVMPWAWLLLGAGPGWPAWPAAMIALGLATRGVTASATGQRLADVPWLPVSVLAMTLISLQAAWWQLRYGGPLWKERTVSTRDWRGRIDAPR